MAHPRELIGEAVVALLVTASTAAEGRVEANQTENHKKTGLPALAVYTLDDPAADVASSEMEIGHALELKIACWADPGAISDLAQQVEVAMRADEYIGGLASEVVFRGTVVAPDVSGGRGDPLISEAVLTYSVTYHIALAAT